MTRRIGTLSLILVGLLSLLMTAAAPQAEARPIKRSRLEMLLRLRIAPLHAKVGIYALNVPTGRQVAIHADEPMNTASVIKVPILIRAYRDVDDGLIDLDERRTLTMEDYRYGSGMFQTFTPGLQPTLKDIVRQMIVMSDNTATDVSLGLVGLDRVNAMLLDFGFQQTRMNMTSADLSRAIFVLADPKYSTYTDQELYQLGLPPVSADQLQLIFEQVARDPALWLGRTTAREMSQLLLRLLGGELASAASTEAMLNVLLGQFYDSRLPRFIKDQVQVAHKTGELPPYVINDVGILYHEGGPTVVSVLVNDNEGTTLEVEQTIGLIAKDIVRAWSTQAE